MSSIFQGLDFIEFDSLLTEDERLIRDQTRAFIEDNLIPIIEQCNREGRFPRELVKPMGELGFYGATIDGYGCAGISSVEYGLLTQELERGDSGIRSFVSVRRNRRTSGCRSWPLVRNLGVLDSLNPTSGPTLAACGRGHVGTVTATF
jgi:hypothetical protein